MKNSQIRHQFFVDLWDRRERIDDFGDAYVRCYETGKILERYKYRSNSRCYSHILPKNLFSQYELEEWNVVIVDPEAHSQFESFPDLAPKQKALYDKYMKLVNTGKL